MKQIIRASTTMMLPVLGLLWSGSFVAFATEANVVPHNMAVIGQRILLPEFKLDAVPFNEALRQLSAASKQNDPARQGVNYVLMNGSATDICPTITLDLTNVTVAEATERLAKKAGVYSFAEDYAFVFSPRSFVPLHTSLQLAIYNPDRGEYAANAYIEGRAFSPGSGETYACAMRDLKGQECSASIQYRGTENGKDYYFATITAPPGAVGVPAPAEIAYEGRKIEIWKDSAWLIRMGPKRPLQHAADKPSSTGN
jgi:hypothetical protein